MPLHVVSHPVVDDALASLRDVRTVGADFRRIARRLSLLLVAEATRDLPSVETTVKTPLERAPARRLVRRVVAVPVLRAGLGMLEAFLDLVPGAEVGYLGLQRDEETALAHSYYEKVPGGLAEADVFVLDPMLATGGSAASGVAMLRARGARALRLVCIVAAPEGVAHLERAAPDLEIYTAALDRALDDRKYIRPGLGDFGDRLNGE